jgi:hypothetical protein
MMPVHWVKTCQLFKVVAFDYGHLRSVAAGRPLDGTQSPTPWYTYPALEYLKQLDLREKTVFEYGCGGSTLFWGARTAKVFSVEHDRAWYERIRSVAPANCTVIHEPDPDAYVSAISRSGELFDIIVIDGLVPGRTRLKGARIAPSMLRPGGMIILDNADWLPESAHTLRSANLIEVDMTGFAPINDYVCTTSFFLHRDFAFRPLQERQPMPGPGARQYNWEAKAMAERLAGADQETWRQVMSGL